MIANIDSSAKFHLMVWVQSSDYLYATNLSTVSSENELIVQGQNLSPHFLEEQKQGFLNGDKNSQVTKMLPINLNELLMRKIYFFFMRYFHLSFPATVHFFRKVQYHFAVRDYKLTEETSGRKFIRQLELGWQNLISNLVSLTQL